jgi:rubrerythrin
MHDMTAANLRSAFGGECMAYRRYLVWGDRAEKDSFPNVARLFRAIADAEAVHATNHFNALADDAGDALVASMAGFGIGSTSENLQGAIDGETFEVNEMCATYLEAAKLQEEKRARLSFHYALAAEQTHIDLYGKAKQSVDAAGDVDLGPVQVCEVCGWTAEGEIADKCPICAAKRDQFRTLG